MERAEALAESANALWEEERVHADALYEGDARLALEDADVLINCTSVGLKDPDATPFPWVDAIPTDCYVFDTIYIPPQTRLLKEAVARGCRTRNGLAMLVEQGAESFRLWTGTEPDVNAMERAATAALGIG